MSLHESGEMYLETILVLSKSIGNVRSVDVSEYMGYSKPSVSRAIGVLKKDGYITVNEDGHINLTDSGKIIADKIYERHNLLTSFLIDLGVDKDVASNDACKMEHDISDETFSALKNYIAKK